MTNQGVYGKYKIQKVDGTPCDPNATYFVLRLDTDYAARRAMIMYCRHCDNNALVGEIRACIDELEQPACGCREAMCPHVSMFRSDHAWRYGKEEQVEVLKEVE